MFRRGRQCNRGIYVLVEIHLIREPENCAKPKTSGLTQCNLLIGKKKTNKCDICSRLQEELITQKYQMSSPSQLFSIKDLTLLVWGGKKLPVNVSAIPNYDALRKKSIDLTCPFLLLPPVSKMTSEVTGQLLNIKNISHAIKKCL